ncbi:hypothetical protein chiPu_0033600, partial [Chiloscyllium punctatum]|nr:hypothetical protein [Chiloscyllium punctatum]
MHDWRIAVGGSRSGVRFAVGSVPGWGIAWLGRCPVGGSRSWVGARLGDRGDGAAVPGWGIAEWGAVPGWGIAVMWPR